jgi:hypothetical protein
MTNNMIAEVPVAARMILERKVEESADVELRVVTIAVGASEDTGNQSAALAKHDPYCRSRIDNLAQMLVAGPSAEVWFSKP